MKIFFSILLCISSCIYSETAIRHLIKNYISHNPVILDAGAHIGGDACKTADVWPQATIYAFEPLPNLFAQLVENTKHLPNIHCFQLALGDATQKAKFYVSSGSSDCSSSLLPPKDHLKYHPDVLFKECIEVNVMNLDEWAQKNNVDHIDFMWLDMQGAEMAMLKNAPQILKTVSAIYTEVNFYEVYAGCPTYPEFRAWLESQGFIVAYEDIQRWIDFGDVLFIRKKH